jgi:transposase
VFHVVGMDHTGHVVLRKRIARSALLHFIATLPPLRMGMEACGSAHYWGRCQVNWWAIKSLPLRGYLIRF